MKSLRLLYHRAISDRHNARVLSPYATPHDHPMLANTPDHARNAVLSRCFYFPKQGMYYARIPKNANSTIAKTLATHAGVHRQDDEGRLAKNIFNRIPTPEQFRDAKKIVFLRDPVVRALSGWKDKGFGKSFLRRFKFAGDEVTPPTFLQFLQALEANHFYTNAHFLPQVELIPGTLSDYKVYVIEDLEAGLREICEEVFGRYDGLTQNIPAGPGRNPPATRSGTRKWP
ncbi:hypothetical protein roselon_03308 [Roseibacterium elongatum DSM 19469]|uniref:Sulfotransferase family protein n=1 Tax=Roseicyclus elongatus DSM 19469 TaxID=1294273 RepID=W8S9A8_9RHOB|nr:sulfotransferase family 2 domain-containing protein [Roseibacterium elongatum]AHM05566.1 hypothetical protein roselon_03308 [Roseibacterium elongatum DSM 19469]